MVAIIYRHAIDLRPGNFWHHVTWKCGFELSVMTSLQHQFTRLGAHQFAYLRSVAEGIPMVEAARKYLGIGHGAEAITAHRLTVEQIRAVARRRGDSRWRLIGIEIRDREAPSSKVPSLDEWAQAEGLEDWSHADLQAMHAERFGDVDPNIRRRQMRNARLRERRLALLRELEASAAERPSPTDALEGWLPLPLAKAFGDVGTLTLGDLQRRIARGGRWWKGIPAFGPTKAARLVAHVDALLGSDTMGAPVRFVVGDSEMLSGRHGSNRVKATAAIDADDDRKAMQSWISARAGSPHTAKQYEREAERFILWIVLMRHKSLSDATAEDCRAYMDFLQAIPDTWISRRKVGRMEPGWAPFKGQLTIASQKLAITALHSLFSWLVEARYLASNPWVLVNRKLGDDARHFDDATSRAFTPQAWSAMHAFLEREPPSPSRARLSWLLCFVECTGLRASELLQARREHLVPSQQGWLLRVHGKGRRNRIVPVPPRAMQETARYLLSRGQTLDNMPPEAPLMASLQDAMMPITYPALHQTFTRFVRRALADVPEEVRRHSFRASAHWLRHTHATRAAERNVPPDVLQENLGQSDPRTTARYYRAQIKRRQAEITRAFGDPANEMTE